MPEVREAQAGLAREAGIEGFCYWHYWFGNGRMLLERPFQEVLDSGKPEFPFCLGWANHSWKTSTWTNDGKQRNEMIAEMQYLGEDDYRKHFNYVLKAFQDKRYITVDGKPLFLIFDPIDLPADFIPYWRKLAKEVGLPGIHFVANIQNTNGRPLKDNNGNIVAKGYFATDEAGKYYDYVVYIKGFDAVASLGTWRAEIMSKNKFWFAAQRALANRFNIKIPNIYDYRKIMKNYYVPEDSRENVYPSLLPQWDRSPRSGVNGIYKNSTPEYFKESILEALKLVKNKKAEHRILFLKSWNEWAEGNYVEPDIKFGHGYLDAIHDSII